jgi:hypothetical protein
MMPELREITKIIARLLAGLVFLGTIILSGKVFLTYLMALQGMSGNEPLLETAVFYAVSFTHSFAILGFGVGIAISAFFWEKGRWHLFPLPVVLFSAGGIVGGLSMALLHAALERYESLFRTLTGGGPVGWILLLFLLVSVLVGVASAGFVNYRIHMRGTMRSATIGLTIGLYTMAVGLLIMVLLFFVF